MFVQDQFSIENAPRSKILKGGLYTMGRRNSGSVDFLFWLLMAAFFIPFFFSKTFWQWMLYLALGWITFLAITQLVNGYFKERAERKRQEEADREAARVLAWQQREAALRDLPVQHETCRYKVGRHALETLAMRYGIPHFEYDGKNRRDGTSILAKKIQPRSEPNRFLAELTEYRNRRVDIVHEIGTDYIKTFLPLAEDDRKWFSENKAWEEVIKGNRGFSIKEIAKMHIDRVNKTR